MKKSYFCTLAITALLALGAQSALAESAEISRPGLIAPDLNAGPSLPFAETDYNLALEAAKATKQMLLIEFTGSDWCPPCKRLKKDILTSDAFAAYLKDQKLRFVELDFPRKAGKISKAQMKRQEAILEHYNVTGFPTILIIDSDGMPYGRIVGTAKTPADYLKNVSAILELKTKFATSIADAQKKDGQARAEALVDALNTLPMEYREFQKEVIKEIIANDPSDEFGYAKKTRTTRLLEEQREMLKSFYAKHRGQNSEQGIADSRGEALRLLKTPELQPAIARELNKYISDGYAMLQEFDKTLEYLKAAYEADPDSRAGKSLIPWIKQLEANLEQMKAGK